MDKAMYIAGLAVLCILVLTGCASYSDDVHPSAHPKDAGRETLPRRLSPDELANSTFESEWTESGMAPLANGEWKEPAAPGSATQIKVQLTDKIAYGQLNDQPTAAAVLVTDPGGSGTFYDLALVINRGGKAVNLATTNLGDRVKINSVSIENNQILVDMITHATNDPLCCPTQDVVKRFTLEGDKLVQLSGEAVAAGAFERSEITGIVWKWQQTQYNNDTKAVPSDPGRYTLRLLPDDQTHIQADCNSGGGVYTLKDSQIRIEITHTTMAACPPGSLDRAYIRDLNAAVIYFFEGYDLYLDLKYDTGTMKFSR